MGINEKELCLWDPVTDELFTKLIDECVHFNVPFVGPPVGNALHFKNVRRRKRKFRQAATPDGNVGVKKPKKS